MRSNDMAVMKTRIMIKVLHRKKGLFCVLLVNVMTDQAVYRCALSASIRAIEHF